MRLLQLSVRFSAKELKQIEKSAKACGINQAAWARSVILQKLGLVTPV